ncbi:DsbC family protein [Acinetobacter pollinis]|uniref:DsbC family protein n=1 Tax=Acinetobacter pollinis TaxID=2605270 RepID=UPI0018A27C1C|nr:DsbC family protein [Acinetobacter pollinis]MBF7690024.1 DsbC family protein [Acinetobacter pollinis]MBF7692759.1 DsbC family protein [Acinetobacter pollinis]MBF7697772.1 DsbC family protein [Acinetobacter pollinis]MBF7700762.1 DsbC family protein [Acinetobacter pollinis]
MAFPYSKTLLACTFAVTAIMSGCSKDKAETTKSDSLTATSPATGDVSPILERNEKQRLMKTFQEQLEKANIKIKVTDIKKTEVPNIYWVNLEGMPSVYATSDGKYIIQGDILRLGDTKLHNVSEGLQAQENQKLFEQLNVKDLIVYPAQGQTKHIIYVFTDASCPYCHKLHESLPEITAKGIEVRYIAWPRGDQFLPMMESIWCSKDRQAAFASVVKGENIPQTQCQNPVKSQYALGLNIGVNGTPAVYSQDGHYLGGYLSADDIVKKLEK